MHNCVLSRLCYLKILDEVNKTIFRDEIALCMQLKLVIRYPILKTPVFGDWNQLSSLTGKRKFCRIYWQRILIQQTSLFPVEYRTFLYNPTNPKVPRKSTVPCIMLPAGNSAGLHIRHIHGWRPEIGVDPAVRVISLKCYVSTRQFSTLTRSVYFKSCDWTLCRNQHKGIVALLSIFLHVCPFSIIQLPNLF